MSRICPKCHYQRQPSDSNPDWQCPSCHVAYNKVAAPGDIAGAYRASAAYSATGKQSSSFGKLFGLAVLVVAAFFAYRHYPGSPPIAEAAAAQPEIILYGTERCGYCAQARQFFARHGIEYQNLDIDRSFEAQAEFKRLGGRGVPLFVIDGHVVTGWREERMRNALEPWLR